jgi:hypothetical protein
MKKIGIVVPTNRDHTMTAFWHRLCQIQAFAFRQGYDTQVFIGNGYIPAEMHDDGIAQALNWGAEAVLIVGTDELHPENIIPWFDSQPADILVPVIYQRTGHFDSCLYRTVEFEENGEKVNTPAGLTDVPENEKEPLFEVEAAGSGGMFVRKEVFAKLPIPWFRDLFDMKDKRPFSRRVFGHDIVFCIAARSAGFRIYADLRVRSKHMTIMAVDDAFKRRMIGGVK